MNLQELIERGLSEDLPRGDLTTDKLNLAPFPGRAQLLAKEDLVLAGKSLFEETMRFLDSQVQFHWLFKEGDVVLNRQTVCTIQGDLLKLLRAERVALNFLGHLSGIATLTRCFVEKVAHTDCKILDTRKTLPLYRELEKEAVRIGGGTNHRMNLSEAVMIKDNHIRAAGSLSKAVENIRENYLGPITLECSTLGDVSEAVKLKVERILLDNMDTPMMQEARKMIPKTTEVEASGNMSLERVHEVAELGVDFISVGALTHSAPSADFSLLFNWARDSKP